MRLKSLCCLQAPSLRRVLLVSIPSIVVSMPLFFLLTDVLMDETSMMGVVPPPLGRAVPDAIIGALIGASTAITATTAIPWLGTRLPMKHLRVRFPSKHNHMSDSYPRTWLCPKS